MPYLLREEREERVGNPQERLEYEEEHGALVFPGLCIRSRQSYNFV